MNKSNHNTPEEEITMKRMLLCIFVLTLACSTTLFAADRLLSVHADHLIAGHGALPPAIGVVCSNVGPATNQYGANGYLVLGPSNTLTGSSQFIAAPCTPKTNKILTTVKGAWQYYGTGANEMQVCLYSDSGSNSPGTLMGKCVTKKNLPTFGTANTLVTATFTKQNLALTAGTQYWIVGQLPASGTGSDAQDVWAGESVFASFNSGGSGWTSFQPDLEPVMAVSGK
jgi:hypothetical protein